MLNHGWCIILTCAVLSVAPLPVLAGWTIKPPLGVKTTAITDSQLNAAISTATIQYTYTHSSAQFYPSVGSNSAIFPGSCVGDASNPYGWNYFKSQLLVSVSIGFSGDITIRYQPVYGFSLLKPEVISCGPFVDSEGKPMYSGVLPADDTLLTFQITVNSQSPLIDLRQMQSDGVTLAPYGSKSITVSESLFRNSGIQIYIVLSYDNWNATRMYDIGAQLICTPTAVNCFSGIIQPKHWSMWAPNVVLLNVPRDDARTFNIFPITTPKPQNWVVMWTLNGVTDLGASFTTKGLRITVQTSSTQFNVVPYANPSPQLQFMWSTPPPTRTLSGIPTGLKALSPTIINMTEDCLRGKTSTNCPLELIFSTFSSSTQRQLFSFDPNAFEDVRKYAIVSQTNNFSNFKWVFDLTRETIQNKQMAIIMNAVPQYETWVVDTMTVMPPYTVFDVLEPPVTETGNPFQVVVTPSIGSVQANTTTVTQRQISEGGFTFEYAMDGESFSQATLDNFVTLMVGFNKTDAWENMKATCVLPPGSITYGVTPWKTANTSSIIVRFQPCPDFETLYPDIVTVTLNPNDIRSTMWPIRVGRGMSFNILKSPGAMTYLNSTVWSQGDFISGNVSFYIKLTSERWPTDASMLQNCFNNICDQWTSSVSQTSKDNAGWSTQARRSAICTGAFTKISDRMIRFQGVADPLYRTRIGENILITVPAFCTASGTAPEGNQTIRVNPQSGIVSFALYNGTTTTKLTQMTERDLRSGGFQVLVNSNLDSFDDNRPVTIANEMFAALISNGIEAEGFNNKKSLLISGIQLNPSNPYQMIISFQRTLTYDISTSEAVFLNFSATWMASQSMPSPQTLSFVINSAPGTVAVDDWFGANTVVTEDDVRAGRVWFRFSLLGDQWRREREPYLSIWTGDIPSTSICGDTFTYTVTALIPDVTFFNFTTSALGYDFLTLYLQSDENYDIPQRETVKVSFGTSTVASGISALFDSTNSSSGTSTFWSFFVLPTAGRVLLSGSIYNVNEKMLRQSSSTYWYLTLVGETWVTNVSAPLSSLITAFTATANPSSETSGFLTYKTAFLPSSRITVPSTNVVRLFVAPNTNYQIEIDETIRFIISGLLVNSGLTPYFADPLDVVVSPTGGELESPTALVVTEDFVRTSNFSWTLSLAGDSWNTAAIIQDVTTFLKLGFSSKSPIVKEATGFIANKDALLHLSASPTITQDFNEPSAIRIHFYPTPSYNIDADETVTFTVPSSSYVGRQGYLPNPATVSFTIKAVPQQIVVIVDQRLSYAGTFESQPETFASAVASLMSLSTDRVIAQTNATAHRPRDSLLVMLLTFTATTSTTDTRTSAFLTSTFLSLSTSYLYGILGANYTYLLASPPPDDELYPSTAVTVTQSAGISWSTEQAILWSCVGVLTFIVVDVVFYVVMTLQANKLAVGVLSNKREVVDEGISFDKASPEEAKMSKDVFNRDQETKSTIRAFKERERIAASRRLNKDSSPEGTPSPNQPTKGSNQSADLGPTVATLSGGERVVKPMTLKEYVRKVVDREDPGTITTRDLLKRNDDSDDERVADIGMSKKSNLGDQMRDVEAEQRRRGLFQDAGRPTAKLDAEGKTEAELASLRRRHNRSEPVNRRLSLLDTLVDF